MPVKERVLFFGFSFTVFLSATYGNISGCIFAITNNETEKNQPVLLYNISSEYELAVPHEGSIHLRPGQNITLLCSGSKNYIRQTNSNSTTVTCVKDDKVKLFRWILKFDEIKCKKNVKGEVRPTSEKCGAKEGEIYQIGYPISRTDWLTLISVCYMPEIGNTLYTRHIIHGKEIKYASKSKYRPQFSSEGQHESITASLAYKQAYQKSTFSSILGSSILASQYINEKSFLARGHLAPDADFLLAPAQFSTYYYINAAPQWQSVNGASWKSIELTVRNLATYYGDLEVVTGTHGVLSYNKKEGNVSQNIYLGKNGILPVPKYFWKMVRDIKTGKSLVFIIINDPFITSVEEHVFCQDVCSQNGFTKKSWKDPSSGYVFCCNVRDFIGKVRTAPKLDVRGELSEPTLDIWPTLEHLELF